MSSFYMQMWIILMMAIPSSPVIVPAQSKSNADPLKPYTTCKLPGDLKVQEVYRRPKSMAKYREVTTDKGSEKISVVDGYRVMFAYKGVFYYYANVKIEQSAAESYALDKELIINNLKHVAATDQVTKSLYADKALLNGFEHYGIDRDKIDVGGTIGIHVLFHDADHLIITIYLLNQDDKAAPRSLFGSRRFTNIEQYRILRDDFLNHYTECLKVIAEAKH